MTVQYKQFRIGDILHRINVAKIPYRISEMPKIPCGEYVIPAIACGSQNQGIACYVPETNVTVLQNVISIAANGDGYAFWQPNKFTIIQDAYAVERSDGVPFTESTALFFVAGLQKLLDQSFGWNNKSGWNKIKECSLALPVTPDGTPDWDYMQQRIKELEQQRIKELEQYLIATGLNDYELTDEDRKTLSLSCAGSYEKSDNEAASGMRKEMREFRIGDLFESYLGNIDIQRSDINGCGVPVVSSGEQNLGVIGMTNIEARIFPPGTITVDMFGNAYYRDFSYKMVTHARVFSLSLKGERDTMSKELGMFLTSSMKFLKHMFSFSNMATFDKCFSLRLKLPIQTDLSGSPIIDQDRKYHSDGFIPDFEYMERYIKAIEKIVIKDVVKYKDEMIEKMKDVVASK